MSEIEMKKAEGTVQTKPANRNIAILVVITAVVLVVGIVFLFLPAPISDDVQGMVDVARCVVRQNGDPYAEPYRFAYRPYDNIQELGLSSCAIWDNAPNSGYIFVIRSKYLYLLFFDSDMNLFLTWSSKEHKTLISTLSRGDYVPMEDIYMHEEAELDFRRQEARIDSKKYGYRKIK